MNITPQEEAGVRNFQKWGEQLSQRYTALRVRLATEGRHWQKTSLDERWAQYDQALTDLIIEHNVDFSTLSFPQGLPRLRASHLMGAVETELDRLECVATKTAEVEEVFRQHSLWASEAEALGAERTLGYIEKNANTRLSLVADGKISSSVMLNPKLQFFLQHHR